MVLLPKKTKQKIKIELKFIFIFLLMLMVSCNNKKKEISVSPSIIDVELNKIKYDIINNGSTYSYDKLIDTYEDNEEYYEFLQYALCMANKYDYPPAYYDVYKMLIAPYYTSNQCKQVECHGTVKCLDNKTKKIAIEYFKEAIYKGSLLASKDFLDLYDVNKICLIDELYKDKKLIEIASSNLSNTAFGNVSNSEN